MNNTNFQKDLVVLVADKDMEFTVRGILSRPTALQIRPVETVVFAHPEHDPGCYLRSHDFLRSMARQYSRALVLFDREGCGDAVKTREQLETAVEGRLNSTGWIGRCRAIVLDPELEIWVWSDSPHVASILGWKSATSSLQKWLVNQTFLKEGSVKPDDPKKAMEAVLRLTRLPRSASRFQQLAEKVSLDRCIDAAFLRLKNTLQEWFSANSQNQ